MSDRLKGFFALVAALIVLTLALIISDDAVVSSIVQHYGSQYDTIIQDDEAD